MSTIKTKRTFIAVLCIILAFSFCSCTETFNIVQEVTNVAEFIVDIGDVVALVSESEMTDEEIIALANDTLIHEKSDLTLDAIWEDLKASEKFSQFDTIESFNIEKMPEAADIVASLKYDEAAGGNTYTTTMEFSINGVILSVEVTLLSDASGLGIYDYNIK